MFKHTFTLAIVAALILSPANTIAEEIRDYDMPIAVDIPLEQSAEAETLAVDELADSPAVDVPATADADKGHREVSRNFSGPFVCPHKNCRQCEYGSCCQGFAGRPYGLYHVVLKNRFLLHDHADNTHGYYRCRNRGRYCESYSESQVSIRAAEYDGQNDTEDDDLF